MKCSEIIKILERQSPAEYAMDWDNVGLLVGRRDKEIKKLMLAVDATVNVIDAAVKADIDMIVTHHPMIFGKIGRVNDETVIGRKLLTLAENSICCYAMHTNFDTKGGMAKLAAQRLGLKNSSVLEETLNGEGIGQIGILDNSMTAAMLCEKIKTCFSLDSVMLFGDENQMLEKIAISPGSGKSVISEAVSKGADCLVTGDIGHHEGLDALEQGLSIIDASHYGLEKIFMEYMYGYLKDYLTDVELYIADVGPVFKTI